MISVILNNLGLLKRLSRTVFRLSFRGIFWSLILFLPVTCTRDYINQYRGVCDREGRILSDEEKIRVAVEYINNHYDIIYDDPETHKTLSLDAIPYASVDEFLEKNPNCCKIEHSSKSQSIDTTLFYGNGDEITISYRAMGKTEKAKWCLYNKTLIIFLQIVAIQFID